MSTPQEWPQKWTNSFAPKAVEIAATTGLDDLRAEYKRIMKNMLAVQLMGGVDCMMELRARQLGGTITDLRAAAWKIPSSLDIAAAPAKPSAPAPTGEQRRMWEICDQSIRSRQEDTKRQIAAGGDVNKLSAALGQYQRALFTRQCYDHPQAKEYVASADRMIAGASNGPGTPSSNSMTNGGSGGLDMLADSKTPVNDCLGPKVVGGKFGIANSCDYAIEYVFCVLKPKPDSWSASYNCEKQSFGATGIAARGWNSGLGGGIQVYVFACRKPSLPGKKSFEPGKGIVSRCF